VTDRLLALGDPPAGSKQYTILDESEAMLQKARVSDDLISQVVEGWIQQDQERAATGGEVGPGFIGYYHHVGGGVLDQAPASLVGNSSEARCLDEVISAAGASSGSRAAVQEKLALIFKGIEQVG
jgi:hypothetical protein